MPAIRYALRGAIDSRRNVQLGLRCEELERRDIPSVLAALASRTFLSNMQDEFHVSFPVSYDVSSAGNHFYAVGILQENNVNTQASFNGSWTDHPHSGATSIRNEFKVSQQ